ncbi:MAG: nuclease SbcCD subunit D [Cyclobacteriaceae bacterium]|nr:MAG: nuclease SbcCD subunit D [Cyclobacteriaceae bacterium]
MKILHTADWHLGKRLQGFNRIDEQRQVLHEIVKIADREQVNAVLIAGDLFDTYNPLTEAIELFYSTLHQLSNYGTRAVVAIAGNHDSAERIEAPHPLAANCGIVLFGLPDTVIKPFSLPSGLAVVKSEAGYLELNLPGINYPFRLILTPYANEVTFKKFLGKDRPQDQLRKLLASNWKNLASKYFDKQGVNLLMAHLYFMSKGAPGPEEDDDEKSILFQGGAQAVFTEDLPDSIQYTALGHLHRPQEIPADHPVIYCGSPLSYSFSEADQQKQVEIIEAEPGKPVKRRTIRLKTGKKLTRQRFEDIDGAVNWLEDHPDTYVELTIVADDYLGAKEKQRLYKAHKGIVAIIPELKTSAVQNDKLDSIDLSKDLKSLFVEYFKFRKGQKPDPKLLEIFDEIIHQ